jgi:hypothetical protein
MMLLAGHLQFAAYGLMAVVLAALVRAVSDRRVLVGLLGVVVGAVIAWPQVSLVLANSANSHRKNAPSEEGYAAYVAGALKPFEALSVVHPRLLGDPSADNTVLGDSGLPNAYWPMYAKIGSNPAECALWVSPVVLVLAFVGIFGLVPQKGHAQDSNSSTDSTQDTTTAKKVGSFALTAVPLSLSLLGLLLAFGTPINRLLFFYFPGWSATGSPGRSLVLIVLGVCALAGFGFDRLPERADKKWFALAAIPVALLAIGFNGMNLVAGSLGVENLDKIVAICTGKQLPLVAITAVLGSVMVALLVRQRSILAVGLAVVFTAAWQFPLSGKPVELPKLDVPAQERVAFESKAWNIAKTPQAFWPPNLATVARVHDLFGYDSILDGRFVNRLKGAIGAEPAPPENGNMMLWRKPKGGGLDFASTELHSEGLTDQPGYVKSPQSKRVNVNEGVHRIAEDAFDHQTIEIGSTTTEITVADRYIDGMTSDTPGCEVSNKDGFRFVQCKEGTTRVVLRYPGPKAIYLGLAALATLASLALVFRKQK